MNRGYLGLWLLLALYSAAVAAGYLWTTDASARQLWPVVVTGAILVWYTWETMLLRETAARQAEIALRQRDATLEQIEVAIRPFVIIELDGKGFALKNIGAVPALNARVHDVTIDSVNDIVVKFVPTFPVIPAGATANLQMSSIAQGKEMGDFFAAHLDPRFAVKLLDVVVSYQNVEGKEYRVTHAVGPSTVKVGGFKSPAI